MHHRFLDAYATKNGFLQRLDPRVKIASIGLLVLSISLTGPRSFLVFAGQAAIIIALICLSRVPVAYVARRSLTVIPFVLMIAIFIPFFKEGRIIGRFSFGGVNLTLTHEGLLVLWSVLVKSFLSAIGLILLTATTRFTGLLRGLESLKCPRVIIMILSFMYRYVFLLEDEIERMEQARAARTVGGSRWFHARALANVVGSLFVRSYERGEAVYLAMCSRGFDGNIRTLEEPILVARDVIFLCVFTGLLVGLRLFGGR